MKILGIDIGTQGVRGVVTDEAGHRFAEHSRSFAEWNASDIPGRKEQRPEDWAAAVREVARACAKGAGGIRAVALDGTSGTVLGVDSAGAPLTPGILYNDARAGEQANKVHAAAKTHEAEHGYVFGASFALPKILWVMENQPEAYEQTYKFIHQSDYICGVMTGEYFVTDYSNALKTGYDLLRGEWPAFLEQLGISTEKLPAVVAPGEKIAHISARFARETGLPEDAVLYAGATDGYASSLAAGLALPGDWATVIGTTMVLKGITKKLARDPLGRIYSHKHPQGWWMPGGASNVGGRCLSELFGKEKFDEYNKTALACAPTGDICYPLTCTGERFPFAAPGAEWFYLGDESDPRRKYAAAMEGVGYAERLSYELLAGLGCEVGDAVFTSGGATRSSEWLQIRANILQKRLRVPAATDAAMGSAMIAASGMAGGKLSDAVQSMVKITQVIEPDSSLKARYDQLYGQFCEQLKRRGYLQ